MGQLVSQPLVPLTRRRRRLAEAAPGQRLPSRARRRHRRRSWQQEIGAQAWQRAMAGSALIAVSSALGLAAVHHPVGLPSWSTDVPRADQLHGARPVFAPIAVIPDSSQRVEPLDAPLSGVAPGGSAGPGRSVLGASASTGDQRDLAPTVLLAKQYARSRMAAYGWTDPNQMVCLDRLWTRESGWRVDATNPTSGAYGIPQALPASKLAAAGTDWRTNPWTQIDWGLDYIRARYGSPSNAWAHSEATGWY
jgi:hypothetical protein